MAVFTPLRVAFLAAVCLAIYYGRPQAEQNKKLFRRAVELPELCTKEGQIAMCFDDGVDKVQTPAILDALLDSKVPATFYITPLYLKEQVPGGIARRIANEGHTLGLKYNGPPALSLSTEALVANLNAQAAVLKEVTGKLPKFVRMAYGTTNDSINEVIKNAGFVQTRWNLDSGDYNFCANPVSLNTSVKSAYEKALMEMRKVGPTSKGSFISQHSATCDLGPAIRSVIPMVQQAFEYKFVNIETCLGIQGRYIGESVDGIPSGGGSSSGSGSSGSASSGSSSGPTAIPAPTGKPTQSVSGTTTAGKSGAAILSCSLWLAMALLVGWFAV